MMSVFFDLGDDQRRQQLQRQRAGPAGGAGGGRGEGGALPGHQGAGPGGDQAYYHVTTSAANRLIGEVVQSRRRPLLGPSPG